MDLTSITILSQQPRLIGNSDKMSSIMRQKSERLIGSSMVKIVLSGIDLPILILKENCS
jgi:hypothetical protein